MQITPMQFIVNQAMGKLPDITFRRPTTKPAPPKPKHTWGGVRPGAGGRYKPMNISIDELVNMRQSGATWQEMIDATGLSNKAIQKRLRSVGAYNPRGISDDLVRQAASMRADGLTWVEISAQLGHTPPGIARAVRSRGLL